MNNTDLALMLEIAKDPSDCYLNYKVSKAALKRLIADGLILVETRRMSVWENLPDVTCQSNADRLRTFEAHWKRIAALPWKNRSEIHARLTDDGYAWIDEFRRYEIREQ